MDLKEIEKLAKLCHKVGISQITVNDITITVQPGFIPNRRLTKALDKASGSSASDIESQEEYTEEQILNWSSTSV